MVHKFRMSGLFPVVLFALITSACSGASGEGTTTTGAQGPGSSTSTSTTTTSRPGEEPDRSGVPDFPQPPDVIWRLTQPFGDLTDGEAVWLQARLLPLGGGESLVVWSTQNDGEPRLMAELIETATGARKWLVEWPTELVPMEVGAATANAIVVGGILFTDRSVDVVQSFSRDDGSPRSEIITVFQVISGLPDGDVIIHADSGFSRRPANDLSTVLWTVPGERFDYLGSTKEILFTRGGAFRVSDGEEVSFQNYGGKFTVDGLDRGEYRVTEIGGMTFSYRYITADALFITDGVMRVDPETGAAMWPDYVKGRLVGAAPGLVFMDYYDEESSWAIDAVTGEEKWSFNGSVLRVIPQDGLVWIADADGKAASAIDLASGDTRYRVDADFTRYLVQATSEHHAHLTEFNGLGIRVYDLETGSEVWMSRIDDLVGLDGDVYATASYADGYLIVVVGDRNDNGGTYTVAGLR